MNVFQQERAQHRLTGLYRDMPTDEIRRRLADPDLVPLARTAAEAELASRSTAVASPAPQNRQTPQTPQTPQTGDAPLRTVDHRQAAIVGSVAGVIVLALAWLLVSRDFFFIVLLIMTPTIAAPIGKLFPRFGLGLGVVLVAIPVALGVWAWKTGHLAFNRGGDHFVEALIVSVILFFVLALSWAVGASLIFGARHRGSWAALNRELDQRRDEAISSLTSRG